MEPILFKSENGNCYLYSPVVKELLPIPDSVYCEVKTKGTSNSSLWHSLHEMGYMAASESSLDAYIDFVDIDSALKSLSQIVFETTTSCNLRCEYCCYGEGYTTFDSRRNKKGNLEFETAKAVLDFIDEIFAKEPKTNSPSEPFAISFYGGEPLANFDVIKKIVEYAEGLTFNNRRIFFTMTTNATLLAKYSHFLCEHKFKVLISLDGNREHNRYRKSSEGKETFDLVMSNLEQVKTLYPDWFNTFRFNSVFTNISNIKEVVSWFKSTFGKVPNFSPLHQPTEGSLDYNKIISMLSKFEVPQDMAKDVDVAMQSPLYKRIFEVLNHLFSNVFYKESNLLNDEQHHLATGTCVPFSKRMFVSYTGELHPCEKVNRDTPLGFVKNGKVEIDTEKVASIFMSKIDEAKVICENCYLQECCTKCLFCYSDGKCDSFTNKESFAKLLSQTFSFIESNPGVVSLLENNIIIK